MTQSVNERSHPNRWGNAVFTAGALGVKQPWLDPVTLEARLRADRADTYVYITGAAGTGLTARANRDAFARCELVPGVKTAVPAVDLTTRLAIGERAFALDSPFMFAPTGAMGSGSHRDADLDIARGLVRSRVPMIISTQTDAPMELIGKTLDAETTRLSLPAMPRWFQLYASDRFEDVNASLVKRAIASGCNAIVWTIDMPTFGSRPQDKAAGHVPFMVQNGLGNITTDPVVNEKIAAGAASATGLSLPPGLVSAGTLLRGLPHLVGTAAAMVHNSRAGSGLLWRMTHPGRMLGYARFLTEYYGDHGVGIEYLAKLRAIVDAATPAGQPRIPIIVKGVTSAASAAAALENGADALVVSNHGGRQHDGQRAALDVLPEVVAVAGERPVLFDSGVRTGEDAFKALALGAKAVLVSRPVACAQAFAYHQGGSRLAAAAVDSTLTNLQADLQACMYRMSRPTVDSIRASDVRFTPHAT